MINVFYKFFRCKRFGVIHYISRGESLVHSPNKHNKNNLDSKKKGEIDKRRETKAPTSNQTLQNLMRQPASLQCAFFISGSLFMCFKKLWVNFSLCRDNLLCLPLNITLDEDKERQ